MYSTEQERPDRDLFCLQCGYNLRGLSGDPRRCPECGRHNDLDDLRIPSELIAEQLHRIETRPTVCVAAMFAVAFGLLVTFVGRMPWAALLLIPAGPIWIISLWSFGKLCRFRAGWLSVLGWFHLAGLFWLALWMGLGVAVFYGADLIPEVRSFTVVSVFLGLMVLGLFLKKRVRRRSSKGIYSIAKEKLALFCRGTAVMLLRQEKNQSVRYPDGVGR